jgi:hypothetical protein
MTNKIRQVDPNNLTYFQSEVVRQYNLSPRQIKYTIALYKVYGGNIEEEDFKGAAVLIWLGRYEIYSSLEEANNNISSETDLVTRVNDEEYLLIPDFD